MNAARLKILLWLASLGVAGYLGWFVYDFLDRQEQLSKSVSTDEQTAVLESVEEPEPPKEDVVDYGIVRSVYHSMDWTGTPPPPPPDPSKANEGPKELPKTPVSDLLAVILIQVDTRKPERSLAYVRYKDPALEAASKDLEDIVLRPGETLAGQYSHVEVEAIELEGVRFKFNGEEGRESELVTALTYPGDKIDIVPVGPDGPQVPEGSGMISQAETFVPYRPERTVQVRKNEWLIGTLDAEEFGQNYSSILSRDISYKPYKNPKTRQVEGLRVTRVRSGSVPEQYGISEGEILKSINGYAVKSSSDAISYVKKNADTTDLWTAVFLKNGVEVTRTYRSPEN